MKIVLVLLSVTAMYVVEASIFKFPKPESNFIKSQSTSEIQETTQKLLAERRKHIIFPKSHKKFVVSPKPQTITKNPITPVTKTPLMRKIVFQTKVFDFTTPVSKRAVMKPKLVSERLRVSYGLDSKLIKENTLETSEASEEVNNSDADEEIQTAVYPMQFIVDSNNVRKQRLLRGEEDNDNDSMENEALADWKEFIFLTPKKKVHSSEEDPEQYAATEHSKRLRMKRNDNVIEEENLGTTVSGYKFTWQDSKLTNNLVFKNINS